MLSAFEAALVQVAEGEFARFGGLDEDFPPLSDRIRQYWEDLGFRFKDVEEPWSAVFVSWCLKQAGAKKSEFLFSAQHSQFVHWAIGNAEARRGVFQAFPFDEVALDVGDIVQWNRNGNIFNFDHAAREKSYPSHSAIVTALGRDAAGRFARTVGGNEGDTIGISRIALNEAGIIRQRAKRSFIAVVQTLK